MNRRYGFNRFQFDYHAIANNQVGAKSFLETDPVIHNAHRLLALHGKAALLQLMLKRNFVHSLQQPRPKRRMHVERCIHNHLGYVVFS